MQGKLIIAPYNRKFPYFWKIFSSYLDRPRFGSVFPLLEHNQLYIGGHLEMVRFR